MTTSLEIGSQRGTRSEDLIVLGLTGVLSVADVTALKAVAHEVLAAHGTCFLLADLTGLTGIAADARRQMAEWSKAHTEPMTGVALYGCSFATRALLTLTLNAIKFLGQQQVETVFSRDEAEARAWIAARRLTARAGAA